MAGISKYYRYQLLKKVLIKNVHLQLYTIWGMGSPIMGIIPTICRRISQEKKRAYFLLEGCHFSIEKILLFCSVYRSLTGHQFFTVGVFSKLINICHYNTDSFLQFDKFTLTIFYTLYPSLKKMYRPRQTYVKPYSKKCAKRVIFYILNCFLTVFSTSSTKNCFPQEKNLVTPFFVPEAQ